MQRTHFIVGMLVFVLCCLQCHEVVHIIFLTHLFLARLTAERIGVVHIRIQQAPMCTLREGSTREPGCVLVVLDRFSRILFCLTD